MKRKEYKKEDITIVWEPGKCIHSEHCWKELGAVFKPRSKPWIQPEGTDKERIISQIKRCPSGALSFYQNTENNKSMESENTKIKVELLPNGPMILHGQCEVVNSDGRVENKGSKTAFCRCGASMKKPYCDGSHREAGFEG